MESRKGLNSWFFTNFDQSWAIKGNKGHQTLWSNAVNQKWWIQQQSGPSGHFGLLTVIGIARQGKLIISVVFWDRFLLIILLTNFTLILYNVRSIYSSSPILSRPISGQEPFSQKKIGQVP